MRVSFHQMEYLPFERRHLDGVIRLCEAEGWQSYLADPERTFNALSSPGVITLVAVDEGNVVGFAQVLTDGAIRAYLANMAVASERRGSGIGRQLVRVVLSRITAVYMDLLSTGDADGFYERFRHRRFPGFRIYPAE